MNSEFKWKIRLHILPVPFKTYGFSIVAVKFSQIQISFNQLKSFINWYVEMIMLQSVDKRLK